MKQTKQVYILATAWKNDLQKMKIFKTYLEKNSNKVHKNTHLSGPPPPEKYTGYAFNLHSKYKFIRFLLHCELDSDLTSFSATLMPITKNCGNLIVHIIFQYYWSSHIEVQITWFVRLNRGFHFSAKFKSAEIYCCSNFSMKEGLLFSFPIKSSTA